MQLPTSDSTVITQSGNSQLTEGDIVTNVLCVPTFKFNLLLVSKLTRYLNCCALFFPDFFLLKDLFTGKVKEIGDEVDELYVSRSQKQLRSAEKISLAATRGCEDSEVWHKRLGHMSMSVLKKISMFHNKGSFILSNCDVCPLARQVRLSFPVSHNRSDNCFDLVHMDVWRPYKAATT